jgi:hypothetical protein
VVLLVLVLAEVVQEYHHPLPELQQHIALVLLELQVIVDLLLVQVVLEEVVAVVMAEVVLVLLSYQYLPLSIPEQQQGLQQL